MMEIVIESLQINIKFRQISPFIESQLIQALENNGFELLETTASIKGSGLLAQFLISRIAKKDGCFVNYVPEIGVVGVSGIDFRKCFEKFQELASIVENELKFPLDETAKLYEIILSARIKSDNPLEKINKFIGESKVEKFNDLFGESSFSSLRIIPKNGDVSDVRWHDIRIEPLFANLRNYILRFVYRSDNLEEVEKVAGNLKGHVENIISVIESE